MAAEYGGGDELDDFVIEPVRSDDDPDISDREARRPQKRKADVSSDKPSKKNRPSSGSGAAATGPASNGGVAGEGEGLSKAERRRRQRENRKAKFEKKDGAEDEQMTGDAGSQFEFVWGQFMAAGGDKLSDLELEPIQFDAEAFLDPPAAFLKARRDLKQLRPFIKGLIPDWQSALSKKGAASGRQGKVPGSPCVVIVTTSGMEAANIFRELKEFNSLCRVAKLFAKHMKVEEQQEFLAKQLTRVVVGTPNRLEKLFEIGALKLDQVRVVLIDTRREVKGFTIFNIKEVKHDLISLCQKQLFPLMHQGKLKMALF